MQFVARSCASPSRPILVALVCAALLPGARPAKAVLFYQTGDPNYNTTAPGGSLTNSGWQFEGFWGSFLGTPIAPKYFITAGHVGGTVGDVFNWNGVGYPTTAVYDDPDSDLRIWRICGTFASYAQIYTNSNEAGGARFVVFGRGTQRGAPVTTSTTNLLGQVTVKTNGWQWGPYDGVVRWGQNAVTNIADGDGIFGSGVGDLLQAAFDANGGANECHLSEGDSGGALFLQDGSTWKLAGINYAVDGPYNTSGSGAGFEAAIFDERGLYTTNSLTGGWDLVPPGVGPVPGSFYSTRISAHISWINSVRNGPAPDDGTPILQSAANVSGAYADEMSAVVDDASKTVTVPLPSGTRFFRLRACASLTIGTIHVQGSNLVLTYQ